MNPIEYLRSLLAKATPGRWAYERAVSDTLDCDAEYVIDAVGPRLWNVIHADKDDAQLICAMHSALPALLDVAEAAQRVNAVSAEATKAYPDAENLRLFYVALSDLHDALAKLSEIENGHSSTETNVIGDEK